MCLTDTLEKQHGRLGEQPYELFQSLPQVASRQREKEREKKTDWPKEEKGHKAESSSDGRRGRPYLSGEQLPDFHMKPHGAGHFIGFG